jgi:hypothetical protein
MRYTLFSALALGAMVQISSAAVSVTGTNFSADFLQGIMITDNTGAVLPAGGTSASIAFGNFDAIDFNTANGAAVLAAFNQNGSGNGGMNPAFGGAFNTTRADAATSLDSSDSFTGSNIFIVIGNGTTLAGSTDFVVYDSGVAWPQEVAVVGASVTVRTYQGTLLYGIPTVVSGAGGPFAVNNGKAGVTFGQIPEPSSSLLFGAAGLALLIRRKR